MKKSKGINRSIDLTDNGDFRTGVSEILDGQKYHPGVLPWDSEARLNALLDGSRIDTLPDDEIQRWTTTFTTSNSSTWTTVYNDWEFDREDFEPLKLSEDPYDILNHYVSNLFIEHDKVYMKKLSYHDMITDYDNEYGKYYLHNNNTTSSVYLSRNDLYSRKIDITPEKYRDIHLTDDELIGVKLITGDNTKLKYQKYQYLKQVKSLLDEFKTKNTKFIQHEDLICENCGRPIYRNIPKYHYSANFCYECAIEIRNRQKHHKISLNIYDVEWCNFHDRKCLGEGFKYFGDQQVDGCPEGHDKVIDYFHQYTYDDKGVHLLRIPVGSHELRVNLGTGEFIDDEDEQRRSRFNPPELTFNRLGKRSGHIINRWIDDLTMMVV